MRGVSTVYVISVEDWLIVHLSKKSLLKKVKGSFTDININRNFIVVLYHEKSHHIISWKFISSEKWSVKSLTFFQISVEFKSSISFLAELFTVYQLMIIDLNICKSTYTLPSI